MNHSADTDSSLDLSLPSKLSTAAFGFITFLLNLTLLVYITKILLRSEVKEDNRSFFIQLFSICINDTLCGLTVFLVGVLNVSTGFTLYLCAYTIFLALTLQIASQGNITCISVQRYMYARNIRRLTSVWHSMYTKTLITVNLLIAIISFVTYVSRSTVRKASLFDSTCNYHNVVISERLSVTVAFFLVGIIFTLLSDILCALTLCKLRSQVKVVPDTEVSQPQTSTSQSLDSAGSAIVKKRQQTAAVTLVLIIISFNFSFLPSLISYFINISGVFISAQISRALLGGHRLFETRSNTTSQRFVIIGLANKLYSELLYAKIC